MQPVRSPSANKPFGTKHKIERQDHSGSIAATLVSHLARTCAVTFLPELCSRSLENHCARTRRRQVATTVSGLSDIEPIPCETSQSARSG